MYLASLLELEKILTIILPTARFCQVKIPAQPGLGDRGAKGKCPAPSGPLGAQKNLAKYFFGDYISPRQPHGVTKS
jgi:hypothetical protein